MIVEKHMTSTVQNILRSAYDASCAMAVSQSPGEVFFMSKTVLDLLNVLEATVKDLGNRVYMRNNPQTYDLAKNILDKIRKMPTQDLSAPAREHNIQSLAAINRILEQTKR